MCVGVCVSASDKTSEVAKHPNAIYPTYHDPSNVKQASFGKYHTMPRCRTSVGSCIIVAWAYNKLSMEQKSLQRSFEVHDGHIGVLQE